MKLLVMDVEGTLFKAKYKIDGTDYASTMWQPIANALGEAAIDEERETHKKWDNLEYDNYSDWVKASIDIHRKYNLRKDDFNRLIELAEYNTGVEDFFQCLDRNEWIPVLISGGFQNLIRRAQRELDIEYGFGACEYYFNENDSFLEHYSLNASDFEGKISILNTLLKEFGLNQKTDWVFIGDGKNDEFIAKKAPSRLELILMKN
jgi:phosphoserine phosphatase